MQALQAAFEFRAHLRKRRQIQAQRMVALHSFDECARVEDFSEKEIRREFRTLRIIFRAAILLLAQEHIASHFPTGARKESPARTEKAKPDFRLGTRAHQGRARALIGEAKDIFQSEQRNPSQHFFFLQYDDILIFQSHIRIFGQNKQGIEHVTHSSHPLQGSCIIVGNVHRLLQLRQTQVFQRTAAAFFRHLDLGCRPAGIFLVHLSERMQNEISQILRDFHLLPPMDFIIKKITDRNLAAKHFLKAKRLQDELRNILFAVFRLAALVFNGDGTPKSFLPMQPCACLFPVKFHDIRDAAHTELCRGNAQSARHEQIPARFVQAAVMTFLVDNLPLDCAQVFLPLLLDVNERPLPAAKEEMLDAGDIQPLLFAICHQLMRVQVTPSGRSASSTVTS